MSAALGEQRVPDDDADNELDEDFEEDPIVGRRMRVFRA